MQTLTESGTSRRQFFTSIMPACALACAGCSAVLAQEGGKSSEAQHPFDAEFPRKLTFRQMIGARYGDFIQLAKAMQAEIGNEKTLDFLKKTSSKRMFGYGQAQAAQSEDKGLRSYTEQFRDRDRYKNSLVMEIVEDTDQAFELKVTECLWAEIFRKADAADLGFAWVCHADYAWAQGFNTKIELVRDKTLMEGAPICNHRYVWKG
jgi:hypothetical protein